MGEVAFADAIRAIADVAAEWTDERPRVGIKVEIVVTVGSQCDTGPYRMIGTDRLQQVSQKTALHSLSVFRHFIFSFSDFRRH